MSKCDTVSLGEGKNLSAVVLGAGGFIGGHLLRELIARGDYAGRVTGVDIKPVSQWYQLPQGIADAHFTKWTCGMQRSGSAAIRGADHVFC